MFHYLLAHILLLLTGNDFSYDGELTHRFRSISEIRQTTSFLIDLINDHRNEYSEQFIVAVDVTNIQNPDDTFNPGSSLRLFATVTIPVDPDHPDSKSIELNIN